MKGELPGDGLKGSLKVNASGGSFRETEWTGNLGEVASRRSLRRNASSGMLQEECFKKNASRELLEE